MGNNDLNIEPKELRNYADGMQKDLERMMNELNTVTNVVNETADSFIGIGAEEIRNKYGLVSSNFETFKEIIENYISFLREVSYIYESKDSKIKQILRFIFHHRTTTRKTTSWFKNNLFRSNIS